ncbi:MAG: ABC transporter ATP-binding protein, partial [Acidimicrobiales bacterium]
MAVDVQDVSKRFRLYHEKYTSLKEKVIHAGRVPYEELWALRGVSFDVQEGETLGILGRNGSGKSTLLKCVCGVLQPTSGRVVVRGKLAGLLELGAGFQQELSGRENIYLNGSMLGLARREVDRMFDDIVEFAELGQFIDNQVKFYSSGMYVRLGFAVAVNVDPDVLVIDEVLAVGDERFQRKCMDRIKLFQKEGRTIIFVSHSPDQVRSICDRAVVLADGNMIALGVPGEAVRIFREHLLEAGGVLAQQAQPVEVPAPPPAPGASHGPG